jgi:putative endopeptidase
MKFQYIVVLAVVLTLLSCQKQKTKIAEVRDPLVEHRDTTINPGKDFFNYANGVWFKNNPIPSSESTNGIFLTIGDSVNTLLRVICEKAARDSQAVKGSNQQKIGSFFNTGMDTATIEKLGVTPLNDEFKKIEQIKDIKSVVEMTAYMHTFFVHPMFRFYVGQDDRNSSKNACQLIQGGLGLPDRDYYFNTDERTTKIRDEYVKHLSKMFQLLGEEVSIADKHSKAVMQLETRLAKSSRTMEELRNPVRNYNKMTIAQLEKLTPAMKWTELFKVMGLNQVDSVIVGQPEFFQQINKELKTTSIEDWKTYLRWNLINTFAWSLNQAYDKQDFYFYETVLRGTTEQKPRWKRIVEQTEGSLEEIVSQEYVANYLPKNAKEKLIEIGKNIKDVFREHITNLDWMSPETKAKALNKLEKVQMKLGYPDKWRDYSNLQIENDAWVLNIMRVNKYHYNYNIQKYGKPVDRTEWGMTAETYNAYYSPSNNEICIPACNIIVPGFKGMEPDDAALYAIIGGSTFAHEITHGFDDQGRQYDENGNLHNWWTNEDSVKFTERTKLLVDQFNGYVVVDSLHIRGEATLGENIADLAGVVMGLEAFKKTEQFKSGKAINGLSPLQRYFLGYANAWMVNRRKEDLARQIMTDVHSPAQYRVIGPVVNINEFYEAFNVKPTDPLFREEKLRAKIW